MTEQGKIVSPLDPESLRRIADALERLAPPARAAADLGAADAFIWHPGRGLIAVPRVNRVDMSLLKGIDRMRDILIENTERFARGLPANNALLWGARGMGKSSLVKAAHAGVNAGLGAKAGILKLVEIHREDIESLPDLMTVLRPQPWRFIVFCDDLSFDADDTSYKSLKAVLEGGIEGRPENVILYATSNRRHLMSRDMMENERSTAINPGETVEEKVSLSDRFGLWLGFHRCSQDEFLAMVEGYVAYFKRPDRRRGAAPRGARMGDHARLALRPRRLAVRAGSRRPARRHAERQGVAQYRRSMPSDLIRGTVRRICAADSRTSHEYCARPGRAVTASPDQDALRRRFSSTAGTASGRPGSSLCGSRSAAAATTRCRSGPISRSPVRAAPRRCA